MNQALLDKLKRSPQLPTLPAIAIQALELIRKDNININEIADLIANDPALSTKILKTVNSPFYGFPKRVSTISHALVILGLQAVKMLALGFSLLTDLRGNAPTGSPPFDYIAFWKRSIYSAVAARLIARKIDLLQQEEAFLAGLLADIGILCLHRVVGNEYDELYAKSAGDHQALIELTRAQFDVDHVAVGGMLAEHWQLPPVLTEPIAFRTDPAQADPQLKTLVEVVHAALIVGNVFASDNPACHILSVRKEMSERFKFSPPDIEAILIEIGTSTREAAKLFELNIGQYRSYQEILDEAKQTLIQLSLQSQHQVQTIKKENDELQVKATTDPLTGLSNRTRFDEFFNDQFSLAFKFQRPLSILFIDLDLFKEINDTHGHQAGDEVLKNIGKILKRNLRNIDLAARYGGEEFVLVLTETDSYVAAQTADRIRQIIQNEQITFEDKTLRITASIGVAGTDRTRIFTQPRQLTNAADRAVYAAKTAGRNCVRLFRPTPQTATAK